MKHLLKKGLAFTVVLAVILSVLSISAFAAGSSVAFSKSKLNVGETLTVTARFSTSSSDPMYGLEGYITYDPAIIEFVSGDNCNLLTKGKVKIVLQSAGKTNLTETIKFKTLKVGKSSIALEQFVYVNKNDQEKSLSGSSAVINVVDPSTTASSNANLTGLIVSSGTLTPKFDSNVTEYSITIKNDVTELWVSTKKADANATVNVEGSKDMKVGLNKRVVVVTAQNGATKRYTLNITRLGADGQQVVPPTENEEPLNDLIEVNVGEDTMYVVEDFADAELPKGFDVEEYAFNGKTVPALSDNDYIILMLRLPDDSKRSFYIYGDQGVFTELVTIMVGENPYYILPTDEVPDGYSAVNDFAIGDVVVPAFRSDEAGFGDFAVVYAMGPAGVTGYYSYDTVENTIQRITNISIETTTPNVEIPDEEDEDKNTLNVIIDNLASLNVNGKIVAVTLIAIILLLVAAIVILIIKLATSGRKDDDYDDYEAVETGEDIVGFDYISVAENETNNETTELPQEETVSNENEEIDETEKTTPEESEETEE